MFDESQFFNLALNVSLSLLGLYALQNISNLASLTVITFFIPYIWHTNFSTSENVFEYIFSDFPKSLNDFWKLVILSNILNGFCFSFL